MYYRNAEDNFIISNSFDSDEIILVGRKIFLKLSDDAKNLQRWLLYIETMQTDRHEI